MADKSWKRWERQVAAQLKGQRVTRGADFSQSAPDVEHEVFAIECKYRKKLPTFLVDGLSQAGKYSDKTPLLVVKQRGMRGGIACMWFDDFVDWYGDV